MNGLKIAALLLPALALVACGNPKLEPQDPTFTLRLEPSVLNLRVTESGTVKVIVTRSAGFSEAIAVELGGEATGLEAPPINVTGNEGTLKIRISDAATIGTTAPNVVGKSGTITRRETLTLRVAKAIATIGSATLQNNLREVRQGAGLVTVNVQGGNLERVTSAKLGDLTTTIQKRSATTLELQANVPHGASLGAKDLVLSSDGGDTTTPAVFHVTKIASAPTGNDSTGFGTLERPYRSLTKALSVAQAGDTVYLKNGTYNADTGDEVWPTSRGGFNAFFVVGDATPNVPNGVAVEGESQTGTILEGPDNIYSYDDSFALVFAGVGAAKNFSAKGFTVGVDVKSGDVHLENITSQNNGAGFRVVGGKASLKTCEAKNNSIGVYGFGTGNLEATGGSSHNNTTGYSFSGTTTFKGSDLAAHTNDTGISLNDQTNATLERVKVYDNQDIGLSIGSIFSVQGSKTVARIVDSEIRTNFYGLGFGGKQLVMRGTNIHDNYYAGLTVIGIPEEINLGTFTEAGNNVFNNNGSYAIGASQITDNRLYPKKLDHVVFTVSATTLNGVKPTPDIYAGQHLDKPYFVILSANNTIQFF